MNCTALYSTLYRVHRLAHTVVRVFTRLFDMQLLALYELATIADTPLIGFAGPDLRFAAALTVFIFAPRAFDTALARIGARYRRV